MKSELRVVVERVADGEFRASDGQGSELRIDKPVALGGAAGAWQPTALLLAALGGCLSMDMEYVLRKQGFDPGRYSVVLTGERASAPGKPFTILHAAHSWDGEVAEEVVRAAIAQVDERYCTVGLTLQHGVSLHHTLVAGHDTDG
jgi:putative redox protein